MPEHPSKRVWKPVPCFPERRGAYNLPYNRQYMAFAQEQQDALYLLQGIENGTLAPSTAARLVSEADPALVYFIFTWLRARYGGDHPAAEGVIGRLVELTNGYNSVKEQMREGKQDSIVDWFEDEYSYRDFTAPAFIELVIEKLEG